MESTDFVTTLFHERNNPDKVTVAFTMALKAVEKGHSATVILMADGVHLGKPGHADGLDIGEPFRPVPDLLEDYLEAGGHVAVCGACMQHNGLSEEDVDDRFTIVDADETIDLTMEAQGGLQIT
ncbi:MAG: DsrE family protein [Halodesulfurarchaeum sp.]